MNIGRLLLQKINTKQINATLHFPQKENESRKAIWSACIRGRQMGQSGVLLLQKRMTATLQKLRKPVAYAEASFWQFMGRDNYFIIERAKEEPGAN